MLPSLLYLNEVDLLEGASGVEYCVHHQVAAQHAKESRQLEKVAK